MSTERRDVFIFPIVGAWASPELPAVLDRYFATCPVGDTPIILDIGTSDGGSRRLQLGRKVAECDPELVCTIIGEHQVKPADWPV